MSVRMTTDVAWQGQADCVRGWVEARAKDGDWGDGFLDSLAGHLPAE